MKVDEKDQETRERTEGLGPSSAGNRMKKETEAERELDRERSSSPLNTHLGLQRPRLIQN